MGVSDVGIWDSDDAMDVVDATRNFLRNYTIESECSDLELIALVEIYSSLPFLNDEDWGEFVSPLIDKIIELQDYENWDEPDERKNFVENWVKEIKSKFLVEKESERQNLPTGHVTIEWDLPKKTVVGDWLLTEEEWAKEVEKRTGMTLEEFLDRGGRI
jgi:hypothetical protein